MTSAPDNLPAPSWEAFGDYPLLPWAEGQGQTSRFLENDEQAPDPSPAPDEDSMLSSSRGHHREHPPPDDEDAREEDESAPLDERSDTPMRNGRDTMSLVGVEDNADHEEKHSSRRSNWVPLALHRWVLIVLALIFVVQIAVIEVLFQVSNKNHGLSTGNSTNHYLWTYGPTAVFMIISAIWNQIEYRTKQLTPWALLNKKPETPTRSILLDYVSPWNVPVLLKALRRFHWPVVLAILGTLALQLAAVSSTGLFTLESVFFENIDIATSSQYAFNPIGFSASQGDGLIPFLTVGIGWKGLAYPLGTSSEHAFQPFNLSSKTITSADTLITADVDVFTPGLDCEQGTVIEKELQCSNRQCKPLKLNLTIGTSSCAGYFSTSLDNLEGGFGYFGSAQHLTCNVTESEVERLMFIAAHWKNISSVDKLQVLSCMPSYNITRQLVSIDTSGQVRVLRPSPRNAGSGNHALNTSSLPPMDIGVALLSRLAASENTLANLWESATDDVNGANFDPFFRVANLTNSYSSAQWMTRYNLEDGVKRTYRSLVVQLAKQELMQPSVEPLSGFMSATQDRVVVRELSVRIMESSLIILILICGGLFVLRPVQCTPRDPGSILGQLIVLGRSLELARTVGKAITDEKLETVTTGKLYHGTMPTGVDATSWSIRVMPNAGINGTRRNDKKGKKSTKSEWWQPWSLKLLGRCLAILTPFLFIVGLEVTYQVSRNQNGLGAIGDNQYSKYVGAYVPAALMLVVRILYEGIFSSAKILQPYLRLKKEPCSIGDAAITQNSQARLAVQSFWAGRSGNYGVSAAALASVLAPFLTIVASGLYVFEPTESMRAVQISRADVFNSSMGRERPLEMQDAVDANLIGALIVTVGVAYPQWTHGELALSKLDIGSLMDSKNHAHISDSTIDSNNSTGDEFTTGSNIPDPLRNETSFLQIRIPSIRGDLQCRHIRRESLNITMRAGNHTTPQSLDADISGGCGYEYSVTLPDDILVGDYFGAYGGVPYIDGGYCPEVILAFGHLPNNHTTDQINAFLCNASVDILDADTKLLLPGHIIAAAEPIEASRQQLIPDLIPYSSFRLILPAAVRNDSNGSRYDEFWSAVMNNKELGLTTGDLVQHPERVLNGAKHIFRVLLAQTMSSLGRVSAGLDSSTNNAADTDTQPTTLNGTLTIPNVVRVKQTSISTRILEALLAAMLFLCIIAFYFIHSRDLLPLNPCSIGSAATYLAPSQLVWQGLLPPDAALRRKSELLENSRLKGLMVSLGWWGDNEGRRYGVDIGGAE
ncbi:hypothetical protein BDW75DRAFT_246306 [Aspergillus navahoensis]